MRVAEGPLAHPRRWTNLAWRIRSQKKHSIARNEGRMFAMKRMPFRLASCSLAGLLAFAGHARGEVFNWNVLGGGNQSWTTATNWLPNTDFPDAINESANLSVALTVPLNVTLGGATVTVGGLNIGGSAGPLSTEISNGKLILSNNDDPDFDDNNQINGNDFLIWQRNIGTGTTNATGDADFNAQVNGADLASWKALFGAGGTNATNAPPINAGIVTLNSNGAVGTVNTISATVRSGVLVTAAPVLYRAETVEVRGTRSLNLSGGYRISGGAAGTPDTVGNQGNVLRSYLPEGEVLTIGSLVLEEDSETPPATNRTMTFNDGNSAEGDITFSGPISGGGSVNFGINGAGAPVATYVLAGNNTHTGTINFNRAQLVLAHDNALGDAAGGAALRAQGPNQMGKNIASDNDTRSVAAEFIIAQPVTINGTNSLTMTGVAVQTNNARGITNVLPAGKTFTFNGKIYAFTAEDGASRNFVFDGSGRTIVNGDLSIARYNTSTNLEVPAQTTELNNFIKRGSGAVYVNGGATYSGTTVVDGGNWHYDVFDDNIGTSTITINFGAVGADAFETGGVPDTMQTNFSFFTKISATSTGGVEIAPGEANATFDYTNGGMGTGLGAVLSLAAPDTGRTFTGSIIPADATYRLGGGSGTLTLPNAQLTGGNRLIALNGGVVQLNGGNTYTGVTSAVAKYTTSNTAAALVNGGGAGTVYGGTVIATTNLQNGGAPSGIGQSSSLASNLVIQGSTFRYNGSANATTDRLFTVGTGGATIESSGTGSVTFANTGDLVMNAPAARNGTKAATTTISGLGDTSDLVIGMAVSGPGIAANTTITGITNSTTITVNNAATDSNTDSLTFTAIARALTLGGTNAGDNTLRPNIGNGAAATSLVKNGDGRWILTGNNAYTGTTTVNGGTLLVNGVHSGNGAVTVATAGTLGGTGSITGNIAVNGTLAPGVNAGALNVTGNVTFNAGSTALIQIGGTGAGQFDELILSGALTAGGAFDVDLINGFNPSIGNSFDVLDFGSASGTFTLALPALGAGMAWNTTALLTTGTISIVAGSTAIPEPTSIALALGAMVAGRVHRRRTRPSQLAC
jgi:fibronectin-binding autotransporter adhesin